MERILYKGSHFVCDEWYLYDEKVGKFKSGTNGFVKIVDIDKDKHPDGVFRLKDRQDIDIKELGLTVRLVNVDYKRSRIGHNDTIEGVFSKCKKWTKEPGKKQDAAGPDSDAREGEDDKPDDTPEQPEPEAPEPDVVDPAIRVVCTKDKGESMYHEAPEKVFAAGTDEARVNAMIDEKIKGIKKPRVRTTKISVDGVVTDLPTDYIAPSDGTFELIVTLILTKIALLVSGPAGSGKTITLQAVCEALEYRYYVFSCTEGVQEYHVTGRTRIIDGETITEDTVVKQWARGEWRNETNPKTDKPYKGAVLVVEEMDASDPNVALLWNLVVANRLLETREPDMPVIEVDKDSQIAFVLNTLGYGSDHAYTGRAQLDRATLDRLIAGTVMFAYNDAVEEAIVDTDVLEWGRELRTIIKERGLRGRWVSTRMLHNMSRRRAVDKKGWMKAYLSHWDESEQKYVRKALGGTK